MEQDGNTDEGEEMLLTELEIHEQESFAAALALTNFLAAQSESKQPKDWFPFAGSAPARRLQSTRRRPVSWGKDGVDGGPSSVDIILKWLTADRNLQRWRGDTAEDKTKKIWQPRSLR
ncbi:hypothetical protein GQ600_24573 [Phytophthora cactorum]|nr:hypothetical protein GQ600_24573 [Phytophthora cactorum]